MSCSPSGQHRSTAWEEDFLSSVHDTSPLHSVNASPEDENLLGNPCIVLPRPLHLTVYRSVLPLDGASWTDGVLLSIDRLYVLFVKMSSWMYFISVLFKVSPVKWMHALWLCPHYGWFVNHLFHWRQSLFFVPLSDWLLQTSQSCFSLQSPVY